MSKSFTCFSRLGMLFCLGCITCCTESQKGEILGINSKMIHLERHVGNPNEWKGKIVDVSSTLVKSKTRLSLEIETIPLRSIKSFQKIQFLDEVSGWIAGDSELYKSTDGGDQWERVNVALPEDARITAMFFLDRSLGWLALDRCDPEIFCNQHYFRLIRTADGGQTWQTQYEASDSVGRALYFFDKENGWLIGSRFKASFAPLLLRTSNQGRDWIDVSDGINLGLNENKNLRRSLAQDHAMEMISGNRLSLAVATSSMRLLRTVNDGQTWDEIAHLANEPAQTRLVGFGIHNYKYWLAGGALSEEGVWSILARQQKGDLWTRYRLNGVCFRDVYFIDADKILACGCVPRAGHLRTADRPTDGVILGSLDGGKSWTIIHRDSRVGSLNALSIDHLGRVWVIGSSGLVLRLGTASKIL